MRRSMDTDRSLWAVGWRPGSFLIITLFLAGDLIHDVARGTVNARHVSLDVVSLTVAFLAFAGSAWQAWRARRRARGAAAAPDRVQGSSGG